MADFRYGKNYFPERAPKWSLCLGRHLKVRSQSSREIKNVTISEFSTSLKLTNLGNNFFYG